MKLGLYQHLLNWNYSLDLDVEAVSGVLCPFFAMLKTLQMNSFLKDQHSRTVGDISPWVCHSYKT